MLKKPVFYYLLKKRTLICLAVFALYCTDTIAQNLSVESKVKPAFKEYFGLPRASVFLHLNKSDYVKGEHIWFKGYLYNRLKSTPFSENVNLYVGIYDQEGDQLKKELFISKNGFSQGQIQLDSTFTAGLYYIKAATSWMRNFKEDDSYIQQIRVLDNSPEEAVAANAGILDVQFLPEGGNLIVGVQGTVGVKVLNPSGYGVPDLEGTVKSAQGETVATFRTNRFGLAKFEITPDEFQTYSAILKNGEAIKKSYPLPKIDTLGIGISVKRISSDRIMILLGTNADTRTKMGTKPYTLLIHRDGLLKQMDVRFPENESYVPYLLQPKDFHSGTNIITLVDNMGNPIAERLIFNRYNINFGEVKAVLDGVEGDSVSIALSNTTKSESINMVSVSVLPVQTKAYQHKKNILSTFLLSPYVSGFIENPSYYFQKISETKNNDLDLLLLTQGWSRYKWSAIYKDPPIKKYDYKTGVDLLGNINSKIAKNNEFMLYPGKNADPLVIALAEETKNFSVANYYLENGENLKLTLLSKNGRFSRPNLYIRIENGITKDKVYDIRRENHKMLFTANAIENFVLPDNIIELEEVSVTEKRKKKRFSRPIIAEERLTSVTQVTENFYPNLLDLIRSSGFNVMVLHNPGVNNRIRITSKRPSRLSLTPPSPRLYVDDIPYSDFDILLDFPLTKIESYFIDRSGNGEPGAAGGVIRVYTRSEGEVGAAGVREAAKEPKFFTHKITNGFSPIRQFYIPKYSSLTDDSFLNFGTIHWEPNATVKRNEKAVVKFRKLESNKFKLFIEGMGTDGQLFSQIETFNLSTSD